MAKGNDMMKLHLLSEEMYEELIKEIDTLGELLVEKCGAVPSPEWCDTYLEIQAYEFQESLCILTQYIQSYIDALTFAYPNQASDVQSTLDEWLRYWNKQMNYFVKRQEI
jgi:DNA-binding ferritin-like protein